MLNFWLNFLHFCAKMPEKDKIHQEHGIVAAASAVTSPARKDAKIDGRRIKPIKQK
ncbi:MAG: hypothetical protein IKW97_05860 [Muribaculaceae bacterium]|nr:hypothetical protein [Muribaculaceae bacterium]